jgi:L-galactose dehydrogenase
VGYKPLGRTGLIVSELSIGGATLGNEYGEIDADQAIETVRFGIEHGLNLVDTSPYYGDGLSERRLGEALQDGFRDRIVLATKAGRYRGVEGGFDYSYDGILRSWDERAEYLQTDYLDLYQLHDIEFVRPELVAEQAWPAMVRLREEGRVGHIGITGYPLGHLARLARELDPTPETLLTYCHYSLLNTSFDDVLLPTARELGIGVVNAAITHMGILTEAGAPGWHPAPPEIHEVGRQIRESIARRGLSVTDVALRFALEHPDIATTCVGMRSIDEVRQNLDVLDMELDRDLLAEIEDLAGPVRKRSWAQGHPDNSGHASGSGED